MAEKAKKTKGKVAAPVMPSKKTMNFVHHVSSFRPEKVLPLAILLLIAIVVFVKVGFLDLSEQKSHAYSVVAYKKNDLAMINAKLENYDEVSDKYGRYSYGFMNDSEVNAVNRLDVLQLIEQKVAPLATVSTMSITGNDLKIDISGLNLEQLSTLITSLEASPLVATLHNVVADSGNNASVSMSITLQKATEEAEAE